MSIRLHSRTMLKPGSYCRFEEGYCADRLENGEAQHQRRVLKLQQF